MINEIFWCNMMLIVIKYMNSCKNGDTYPKKMQYFILVFILEITGIKLSINTKSVTYWVLHVNN